MPRPPPLPACPALSAKPWWWLTYLHLLSLWLWLASCALRPLQASQLFSALSLSPLALSACMCVSVCWVGEACVWELG